MSQKSDLIDEPVNFDYYTNPPEHAGYDAFGNQNDLVPGLMARVRVSDRVMTVGLLTSVNTYHCMVCIDNENTVRSINLAQEASENTIFNSLTIPKGKNKWP